MPKHTYDVSAMLNAETLPYTKRLWRLTVTFKLMGNPTLLQVNFVFLFTQILQLKSIQTYLHERQPFCVTCSIAALSCRVKQHCRIAWINMHMLPKMTYRSNLKR